MGAVGMGKSRTKHQPAPAPDTSTPEHSGEKPRMIANMRERDRTQSVNSAFSSLRELIPTEPLDRKLSKIETLRLATSYIQHLAVQLHADDSMFGSPCNVLSGEKRKRTICTFCVANMKKSKTDSLSHGSMIGGYPDRDLGARAPARGSVRPRTLFLLIDRVIQR